MYSDCGRQGSPRVKLGRRVVSRGGDMGVGVPARLMSRLMRGGVLGEASCSRLALLPSEEKQGNEDEFFVR